MEINGIYNNGVPISVRDIPDREKSIALDDFSEGSPSLKKCLDTLWRQGLYTKACCKGDHSSNDKYSKKNVDYSGIAYIAFEPEIDVFSYLPAEFIKNELIVLEFANNIQVIRIYGENKDDLFLQLEKAVRLGFKNDNSQLLAEKINKKVGFQVELDTYIHRLKLDNIPNEIIRKVIPLRITANCICEKISDKLKKGEKEEVVMPYYKLMKEIITEYTSLINNFISKNNQDSLEDTQENIIIR